MFSCKDPEVFEIDYLLGFSFVLLILILSMIGFLVFKILQACKRGSLARNQDKKRQSSSVRKSQSWKTELGEFLSLLPDLVGSIFCSILFLHVVLNTTLNIYSGWDSVLCFVEQERLNEVLQIRLMGVAIGLKVILIGIKRFYLIDKFNRPVFGLSWIWNLLAGPFVIDKLKYEKKYLKEGEADKTNLRGYTGSYIKKKLLSARPLLRLQSIQYYFYGFAMYFLWANPIREQIRPPVDLTIHAVQQTLLAAVGFLVIFVYDDWNIIFDYYFLQEKKVVASHWRNKVVGANLFIFFLILLNVLLRYDLELFLYTLFFGGILLVPILRSSPN